jgi:hypothetical protein
VDFAKAQATLEMENARAAQIAAASHNVHVPRLKLRKPSTPPESPNNAQATQAVQAPVPAPVPAAAPAQALEVAAPTIAPAPLDWSENPLPTPVSTSSAPKAIPRKLVLTARVAAPIPQPPVVAAQTAREYSTVWQAENKPWQAKGDNVPTSGYQGCVPGSALMNGKSRATLTRRALENFRDPSMVAANDSLWKKESMKERDSNVTVQLYRRAQTARLDKKSQTQNEIRIPETFLQNGKEAQQQKWKYKPEEHPYRGKCAVLGYSGCIPGMVHLSGGTFTSLSRQAYAGEHVKTLNITPTTALNFPQPMNPGYEEMLRKHGKPEPPVKVGHILGYSGFIPARAVQTSIYVIIMYIYVHM